MMSGVMVKLVFSGSLKSVLIFSVLPMFGMALSYFGFGAVSSVLGVLYALAEQNMTSKTLGLSHGRKYRYHYDGGGRWYDWYRDTSSSISNRGLTWWVIPLT